MPTLGLYIQFPFCASKCSFCNFSSQVAPGSAFSPYLHALESEVDLLRQRLRPAGIREDLFSLVVDTAYCGGGTPSLAGAATLARAFATLRQCFRFSESPEWTLEITPGSADRAFLESMLALGVNRLSIGAQSFDDQELKAVGRLHSAAETEAQVREARRAGFRNISLDLLAGLPYQTEASWQRSTARTVALSPEHVSVYLFESDEKSRLGREVRAHGRRYHAESVPDDDFMAGAYERAREGLGREGYVQYEISNFALPGHESRHNRRYWRREPYLGLGAGAHSFDGRLRWSNDSDPEVYQARLHAGELPIAESRTLSPCEEAEEFFFLGLRERRGVPLAVARDRWGQPPLNWWEDRARRLVGEGMLSQEGGWLRLADHALLISNEIFREFLV